MSPSTVGAEEELEIRPEVARRLSDYVCLYIDPRDEQPFYVAAGHRLI